MFTRTDAGLSNEHLFYDVDWVVFCEGTSEEGEVSSLDEAFWTKTLGDLGVNCVCKSMGSKSDLADMIEKVVQGDVDKIVVAVDRDYDHLTGNYIDHPRIIYTHGYSWESDACLEFSIRRVLQLFANIIQCDAIATEFQTYRDTLSRELKRVFALDFKYYNHPGSLFDRKKPLAIIEIGGSGVPRIRKRVLLQNALQLEKHAPPALNKGAYQSSCGFRDFFGKAVSRMVYHWFVKRTARLNGRRRVRYEGAMMCIIDSMNLAEPGLGRNAHYQAQVETLS